MFKYYSRYIAIKIIKIYQKTLSLDHGVMKFLRPYGQCRFHPTCSNYAINAVEKYGIIKGGCKAAWRILRCNPWNEGGIDPVN